MRCVYVYVYIARNRMFRAFPFFYFSFASAKTLFPRIVAVMQRKSGSDTRCASRWELACVYIREEIYFVAGGEYAIVCVESRVRLMNRRESAICFALTIECEKVGC